MDQSNPFYNLNRVLKYFSRLSVFVSSLIRIVGSSIFHVGLWYFLGGTPEAIRVLREERGCSVQDGSESAMF